MTTTATRERPILMSAPMVNAIRAGKKSQTRRVITVEWFRCLDLDDPEDIAKALEMPPFQVGMHLWVRESFGLGWDNGIGGYSALRPTGPQYEKPDKVFYRADGWDESEGRYCWRPSIHMRREYSRLTLEITEVLVAKVTSISHNDALAEGVASVDEFHKLWNRLNAKKGASWENDPWVWIVGFRVV